MKLKTKDIPVIREQYIQNQHNKCLLCEADLDVPCLDHCHKKGHIRGVLCRRCNVLEGKITNSAKRLGIGQEKLFNILKNYAAYQQLESNLIHPTYFTAEEKIERAKVKAKKARLKKKKLKS